MSEIQREPEEIGKMTLEAVNGAAKKSAYRHALRSCSWATPPRSRRACVR